MAHKEIFENLVSLNSIDNLIDEEVNHELQMFIPKNNEDLRLKVLTDQTSCIPSREKRFTNLVNYIIETRENNQENDKLLRGI